MRAGESSRSFVRVLDPSDPWLEQTATAGERAANFRGRVDWDISVALEARCAPLTVVATLHGARRDVGLSEPAHYRFAEQEVESVGGALKDTPANPPWPEEYTNAHHDIVAEQDKVSKKMASLFVNDGDRVQSHAELKVLLRIAELLHRDDVHSKFKKHATYRFRRMFEDGGNERKLWLIVAREHPPLLEQPEVRKELRRMYQNTESREEWARILNVVGIPDNEHDRFR